MKIEGEELSDDSALYRVEVRASDGSYVRVRIEAMYGNIVEIGYKEYKVGKFNPLESESVLKAIEEDSHASAAIFAAAERIVYWKDWAKQQSK